MAQVVRLDEITLSDLPVVGGKNASLGEMITSLSGAGITVPGGFATTADAYRGHLGRAGLDRRIADRLSGVDPEDVVALAAAGTEIRRWIEEAPLSDDLTEQIATAYTALSAEAGAPDGASVAVRSSATAEDLPDASFAGQQETYLNVVGIEEVLTSVRRVFASLYNDRAIAYRVHRGFTHEAVALSAGVQRMVRSDLGVSGVGFSIDTESGFAGVVFLTAAYGLGELLVQGAVNPDEFTVSKVALTAGRPAVLGRHLGTKNRRMVHGAGGVGVAVEAVPDDLTSAFCLTDDEVERMAQMIVSIEGHYGRPMDVEWAKDGITGELMVLQARPETVQSQSDARVLERFHLGDRGPVLTTGRAVGARIGSGVVRVVRSPDEMSRVGDGDVLVADMTDPDWEPVMKRAAAIVTNRGGRTCHAAIIARELEIPAVVGTGDATDLLTDDAEVTVSCAEGETGYVYGGRTDYRVQRIQLDDMPEPPVKLMMNLANPERAFAFSRLPNHGVGLARLEFVINTAIGVHPRALLDHPELPDELRAAIDQRIAGYPDPQTFYVMKLTEAVATIAAAFHPKPVIVRLSDFKSNEYAHLLGGLRYEPTEENPMIGWRGASRYRDPSFRPAFDLECSAVRRVRDDMGFTNVEVMIPFVRTVGELEEVVTILGENGLRRGDNGLRLIMMCEIPSNAVLADRFLDHVDGFSIGSNDLTQMTLALDRDSGLVAELFNERDPAVKAMMSAAIAACLERGKYIGICGQGPSDHPDLAQWLVDEGIESMSLNPDTILETWLQLSGAAPRRDGEG